MSDDGRYALVVIALLGNPFSPDYARARDRGPADALAYSSMNVAVYDLGAVGRLTSAFALEDGPVTEGQRTATGVTIGRSSMEWKDDRLIVHLDERTTPIGHPLRRSIRGTVLIHPENRTDLELAIDDRGEHRWWPVAPLARIEVELASPRIRFRGHGYHDANAGDVAIDTAFEQWSWCRGRSENRALLTYDAMSRRGTARTHAFVVRPDGSTEPLAETRSVELARTGWGVRRSTRADAGSTPKLRHSLENGPFYTRSLIDTKLGGERVLAMNETLAARRLRQAWVRFCTGYRMRLRR